MNTYIIVYDLIKERGSADYTKLHNKIRSFESWCKATESTWFVHTTFNAQEVFSIIHPLLDSNDKLLITRANADARWMNLAPVVSDWLRQHLK